MPRARIVDSRKKNLTAYPELANQGRGAIAVTPEQLKTLYYARPPESELHRARYGRQLNLDRIDLALQSANVGYMRDLTDLGRETIGLDPHLSAVVGKRINAVASVPFAIEEAEGPGVDPARAKLYANIVREQLERVAHFRQSLKQLAWGLYDGRAALENQWVERSGSVRYWLGQLSWIHPRRLQFGPDRELRISDDVYAGYGTFAPIGLALRDVPWKFTQFIPQLFGEYPEREGLMPRCLYWSFFKRFGARDRMMLLELFGKPWRIVTVSEDSTADDVALRDAEAAADRLGGPATTARLPRGTELEVVQVNESAGQVHADVISESDKQISKLVLGQTGTTDPNPGGLNGQQSVVMQDEQSLILTGDSELLSDAVEDCVTDAIIALNYGPAEVIHAPRFVLRPKTLNRKEEADRVKAALDAGMPLALEEVYEVIGFRKPNDEEARLVMSDEIGTFGASRVPKIVDPTPAENVERIGSAIRDIVPEGTDVVPDPADPAAALPGGAPSTGGLLNASDMKIIVKVNEARNDRGLGPLLLPNGARDPDGELTVSAYEAKQKAYGEVIGGAEGKEQSGIPLVPPPPTVPGAPPAAAPENDIDDPEEEDEEPGDEVDELSSALVASVIDLLGNSDVVGPCGHETGAVTLDGKLVQPESAYGSLEDLIDRGAAEASRVAARWATQLAESVEGKTDARDIWKSISAAAEKFDLLTFARAIDRRLVHSMMVGALDSQLEADTDDAVKPSPLERGVRLAKDDEKDAPKPAPKFSRSPYRDALKHFSAKGAISKPLFAKLQSAAKQRAFTVAGLASDHALAIAKSELQNAIASGRSLTDFSSNLKKRFESAGFSVPNKSHLETVFRTNVLGSYNAGRKAQMSQPDVLRSRPYWRILTVPDARRRDTHGAVHGWVLRASDPFWRSKGGPPWGFNCRCRVYSLSAAKAQQYEIRSGTEIRSLPDQGFDAETVYPER